MLSIEEIRSWKQTHPEELLNLSEANLSGAHLRGANLRGAELSEANLSEAELRWADLSGAHLTGANLSEANLRWADLSGAHLRGANLSEAELSGANLRGTNLRWADLSEANLSGAHLPHFQIPEGDLVVWGKKSGIIVKLLIPVEAKRTACLINRKCRAEYARVLEVKNEAKQVVISYESTDTVYTEGNMVYPDSYDDDIRVDCTHGIHFWLTLAEAEEWHG